MVVQWWEAGLIALAAVGAGAINAAVGSGTLITFPTLLALGFPPVLANVSNNIGLVPGGIAASWGYRRELGGQRARLLRLAPCSALGAVAGALLLLRLPDDAFATIVPVLIVTAIVLVLLQPRLAARMAARRHQAPVGPAPVGPAPVGPAPVGPASAGPESTEQRDRGLPWLATLAGTAAAGVYGGYFGAAQGVLLVGLLGWLVTDSLQVANGLKNVLSSVVNAVAAGTFLLVAPDQVDWLIVLLIAVGSSIGGLAGASVGRRLPPAVLRAVIVVVGVVAVARLVLT